MKRHQIWNTSYLSSFHTKLHTLHPPVHCSGATLYTTHSSLAEMVTLIRLFFETGADSMPVSRAHIRTILCAQWKRLRWGDAFISRKAKKQGDLWEVGCFCPFYWPSAGNPSMRANRGSAAQAQQPSLKQQFTLRTPGLSSGPAAIWNEESNRCRPLLRGRHTPVTPGHACCGGSRWTRAGTDRGLSSSNRLQLMLQAELVGFATQNTKLPLYLLRYV